MAMEQYAFLYKTSVPTRDQWQAAIDESGFDFQLDPELKPFKNSGFLPCMFDGDETGFEIYYDDSQELLEEFAEIRQGRDYCISFRFGGFDENAAVMIASYALAKNFRAIVSYEGEKPQDLDSFLSETIACIEESRKSS